jgi:hypothetical protein
MLGAEGAMQADNMQKCRRGCCRGNALIKVADMRSGNEYISGGAMLSFCWYFIADVSGDTGDILMVGTADGWTRLYVYTVA